MAAQKFLSQVNGVITEKQANDSSAGVADAGKLVALDSTGKLDNTVMPVGIGSETDQLPASENLAAGDFVNFWSDAGTVKARKADASVAGKEANGFVLAAVTTGATATVYRPSQSNTQLASMSPGAKQYLSATVPGSRTATAPSGTGQVVQMLGVALNATTMAFNPNDSIVLA